jgi:hypothetical protein
LPARIAQLSQAAAHSDSRFPDELSKLPLDYLGIVVMSSACENKAQRPLNLISASALSVELSGLCPS